LFLLCPPSPWLLFLRCPPSPWLGPWGEVETSSSLSPSSQTVSHRDTVGALCLPVTSPPPSELHPSSSSCSADDVITPGDRCQGAVCMKVEVGVRVKVRCSDRDRPQEGSVELKLQRGEGWSRRGAVLVSALGWGAVAQSAQRAACCRRVL
ncbi:hypothetical protein J4Q44_G00246230, partial [Coregonus suidteri]